MITDKHLGLLTEALVVGSNRSLKVLSLSQNMISDNGMRSLAEMLDINATNIRELRLNWNKITAKGGIAIAEALRTNRHLKVLFMGWNTCGVGTLI